MAFSGQVLDNPVSGERFIFRRTAHDTAGELLTFDMVVDPSGRVPGGHVHPTQQESFEVLTGTMKFRRGLRTVIARPGDTVVVPPGDFHKFANAGDEPALVRVTVEPALRMARSGPVHARVRGGSAGACGTRTGACGHGTAGLAGEPPGPGPALCRGSCHCGGSPAGADPSRRRQGLRNASRRGPPVSVAAWRCGAGQAPPSVGAPGRR